MFSRKILFVTLSILVVGVNITLAAHQSAKEEPPLPQEKMIYRTVAVVGGCLAAYFFAHFNAYFFENRSILSFIALAVTAILMALRIVDTIESKIQQLSTTKLGRALVTFVTATLIPFFLLFISWTTIGYMLDILEEDRARELSSLLKSSIGPALGISLLLNFIGFLIAYNFHTDKLTDLSYALTFSGISVSLFFKYGKKGTITTDIGVLFLVLLWAFRLGTFLLQRILKQGKDGRFDNFRAHFWRFGGFWLLQGISVPIILLPVVFFLTAKKVNTSDASLPLRVFSVGAILLSLIGLLIEHVADQQKYRFKQNKKNKGKWITTGLWYYSRHPNYFGEMLFWSALYFALFPYLSLLQRVMGALGPFYIIFLLSFVSGIPILEDRADERWGENEAYKDYKKRTSVLIPWLVDTFLARGHAPTKN